MPAKTRPKKPAQVTTPDTPGSGYSLGLKSSNVIQVTRTLKSGLAYSALLRLQRFSGLTQEAIGRVAQIPQRTMARRKAEGKLTPFESERLYGLASVFEKAVELFDGKVDAARDWLNSPNKAFAEHSPLQMTETELGAQEVERLIGRLEHGVFS